MRRSRSRFISISYLSVLRILASEGAGADVFSDGELYAELLAGIPRFRVASGHAPLSDSSVGHVPSCTCNATYDINQAWGQLASQGEYPYRGGICGVIRETITLNLLNFSLILCFAHRNRLFLDLLSLYRL
ncbi:MAG: hypothetical protein C4B59_16215 [Candidatus Methanogaster sp.]|uniref:Uncharacterized protein n=1 Tax=Candidatus Methanogaster sp. TaxID=3386292 RepID=A0AC61KYG0_9EURY|nr:MAG: hypothetical protein C4B59_16215 [ANME-2 cluster archaeon]